MNLQKDLTLNALKFRFKEERITVYLTDRSTPDALKFGDEEATKLKKEYNLKDNGKDLYALISPASPGQQPVTKAVSPQFCNGAETCWSVSFLKKYCTSLLTRYFRSLGLPCRNNFVSDTEVWIKTKSPYPNCTGYRVFTLRVQFDSELRSFELLIIAGEIRSVYDSPVIDQVFAETSPDTFGWVVYKTNIIRYDRLSDDARRNLSEVFPCLNASLKSLLHFPYAKPEKNNRYVTFFEQAEQFRREYIDKPDFSRFLEIDTVWKKATPLYFDTEELKKIQFGRGFHTQPKYGLPKYGPVELIDEQVVFLFIGHEDDKPLALTLNDYFLGNYKTEFSGIYGYLQLPYHTEQRLSIWFKDKNNPIPEITRELTSKIQNKVIDGSKKYAAIYLSPHTKFGSLPAQLKIYYGIKELLLSYGIVSQALDVSKAWGKERPILPKKNITERNKAKLTAGFHYSFANIAVATYAKLGGKPWSFGEQETDELIIGVSAYTSRQLGKKYIGSAFSFTNEGMFHGFECFSGSQINELAGSIKIALIKSTQTNPNIRRLVIHFYKKLSNKEIKPIQKALSELQLQIPVVVVTVNKTFSDDLVGFDLSTSHLMPASGHYLEISPYQYLLYNNQLTKGESEETSDREGYPFPLKIFLQQYKPGSSVSMPLTSEEAIPVLEQLCRFSLLYWKSVSRQWMPVTLRYPEMLAQIAPHFRYKDWGELGSDSLWFL